MWLASLLLPNAFLNLLRPVFFSLLGATGVSLVWARGDDLTGPDGVAARVVEREDRGRSALLVAEGVGVTERSDTERAKEGRCWMVWLGDDAEESLLETLERAPKARGVSSSLLSRNAALRLTELDKLEDAESERERRNGGAGAAASTAVRPGERLVQRDMFVPGLWVEGAA